MLRFAVCLSCVGSSRSIIDYEEFLKVWTKHETADIDKVRSNPRLGPASLLALFMRLSRLAVWGLRADSCCWLWLCVQQSKDAKDKTEKKSS